MDLKDDDGPGGAIVPVKATTWVPREREIHTPAPCTHETDTDRHTHARTPRRRRLNQQTRRGTNTLLISPRAAAAKAILRHASHIRNPLRSYLRLLSPTTLPRTTPCYVYCRYW